MAIYEFRCPACDDRFEELVPAGTERAACPKCGSRDGRRLMSVPAEPHRLVTTPGQARRAEDRRGTDRGGALARFKQERAREKRARGGRG
jgi:putative FmdB family regulatory protein